MQNPVLVRLAKRLAGPSASIPTNLPMQSAAPLKGSTRGRRCANLAPAVSTYKTNSAGPT